MEVTLAGKILADQFGAYDHAFTFDQAPICLLGKNSLRDTGHGKGVDESGNDG